MDFGCCSTPVSFSFVGRKEVEPTSLLLVKIIGDMIALSLSVPQGRQFRLSSILV